MTKLAHPKEHGIVPNKDGTTGAAKLEYKVGNTHFIIVVNESSTSLIEEVQKHPDTAAQLHDPQSVRDVLAIDEIYADKVGEQASHQQLQAAFDTIDTHSIVQQIVMNGKFH
ncbi:MAG: hypothetical protein SGILL_009170 [Bacillariaceae sp.]